MSKEEIIKNYMTSLEISREEAEQLYEDDKEDFIGEEGEKLQEKANQVKPKADSKKRQVSKKERKIDNEKLQLLEILASGLENESIDFSIEKEVAIHFSYNNNEYTVKLTKHRPPKK